MGKEVLSQDEVQTLILAMANGGKEFSEDDALRLVDWARTVIISHNLLALTFKGKLVIEMLDDEPSFKLMEVAQ